MGLENRIMSIVIYNIKHAHIPHVSDVSAHMTHNIEWPCFVRCAYEWMNEWMNENVYWQKLKDRKSVV